MTPTDQATALVAALIRAGASPGLCARARLLLRDVSRWEGTSSPPRDGHARWADGGDSEPWKHTKLKWLDSTIGLEPLPPRPLKKLKRESF